MAEIGGMIIGAGVETSEKEKFFIAMDGSIIMLTETKRSDSKDVIWNDMVIGVLAQNRQTGQPVMQIMPFTPYSVKANPYFPMLEVADPAQISQLKIEYSRIKTQLRAAKAGIVTSAANAPKAMSLGDVNSLK